MQEEDVELDSKIKPFIGKESKYCMYLGIHFY
jgi:hypothetical protein